MGSTLCWCNLFRKSAGKVCWTQSPRCLCVPLAGLETVLCVKYLGHGPSEAGGKNMVDAASHATQTHSKVRTRKEKEENNSFVCKQ